MNGEAMAYNKGVIRPAECIREGWQLCRGQYALLLSMSAAGLLLGGLTYQILLGPMLCGLYAVFLDRMRGGRTTFDQLWLGFDHFIPGLLATLVIMGGSMLLFGPIMVVAMGSLIAFTSSSAAHGASPDLYTVFIPLWSGLAAAYLILALIPSVLVIFTYPLIVDRRLGPIEALGLSIRGAWANFFSLLLLLVVVWTIGLAGLLVCYFGVFLVMPIQLAATAVAYRRIFPELPQPE